MRTPGVIFALALTVILILGGVGGVAAGSGKQDNRQGNRQARAATDMLQNPAPPPPPGAPCTRGKKSAKGWQDGNNCKAGQNAGSPTLSGLAAFDVPAALGTTTGTALNAAVTTGAALTATATAKTLILYDTTSAYGWLGELYATGVANLSSYFGTWTAKPVSQYVAGNLAGYTAVIYVGSTYGEPLPSAFLTDVLTTSTPVIWIYDNIWQLTNTAPTTFQDRYGWNAATSYFDFSDVAKVQYKGTDLTRDASNGAGILNPQTPYSLFDSTKITILAQAVRADGTTLPWAIRSGNLTYIGEVPFAYMKEEDRILAFDDLLFDALAPQTVSRHRAMVRLEDLNPQSDPVKLRQVADYLSSEGVPFGFGLSPLFLDPLGYSTGNNCQFGVQCGPSLQVALKDRPALVSAIKYMQGKGGVMVEHGYTHQWAGGPNPYSKMTGDDFEFFRVTENADRTLKFVGPLPGDSVAWARNRITASNQAITAAGLPLPTIFEFPHYAGSALDYQAAGARFPTRWERTLYFNGVLSKSTVTYGQSFGQMFPYAVRDVYGTAVLPENLGSIELEPFYQFPTRQPADLINAAQKNLVVRDGVVGFYYHPDFVPLSYLQATVSGIKGAGYSFVAPSTVAP